MSTTIVWFTHTYGGLKWLYGLFSLMSCRNYVLSCRSFLCNCNMSPFLKCLENGLFWRRRACLCKTFLVTKSWVFDLYLHLTNPFLIILMQLTVPTLSLSLSNSKRIVLGFVKASSNDCVSSTFFSVTCWDLRNAMCAWMNGGIHFSFITRLTHIFLERPSISLRRLKIIGNKS